MTIDKNVPLAPLTTFKIGGPARSFVRVREQNDLRDALLFSKENGLPTLVLGGGSNVLIDDRGFSGLVLKMETVGIEERGDLTIAAAGEEWDALVRHAVSRELFGIENLSGIPGTVGAAPVQNIGAYGQALSQTLAWVEVFDTRMEEVRKLSPVDCDFSYRESVFKKEAGRYVVLRVALRLKRDGRPNLSYKDLSERFEEESPTLREVRQAVLDIRAKKFPDMARWGTAGSFFKNPTLPLPQAQALAKAYSGLPLFPLPEAKAVKVPLGWLLDYRHGLVDLRAVAVGGVSMFENHFLVMVAKRNSSSRDVLALKEIIEEKVFSACGIRIEPEVKIV